MKIETRIANLIRAAYGCLYITSHEEIRVRAALLKAVEDLNTRPNAPKFSLHGYSVSEGILNYETGARRNITEPYEMFDAFHKEKEGAIFLLHDFHLFCEDKNPILWRKLKDAAAHARASAKCIVISACRFSMPPELEREAVLVNFPLPDKDDLRTNLRELARNSGIAADGILPNEDDVIRAASGMTLLEAENAFALSFTETGTIDPEVVYREKCNAVRKNGILEVVDSTVSVDDIGGLGRLKKWLKARRNAFSDKAVQYGVPVPRGFLVVGQPGTGKTLTAKACKSILNLPLLRLDAARLFGSLVGQSESNWRTVHAIAKAMAPCILHVDEVDGATAGHQSSGQTDSGTTMRVIKSILQDMQDNSEGIFYVMTANDVDNLPSPLLRRVDEVWNVELPTQKEREAIWEIQIRKARRDPVNFDLPRLSSISDGYSGAEIEKIVTQSLYVAFDEDREPTTDDMTTLCSGFFPLSKTMAADIERRRKRLEGVAKLASDPEVETATTAVAPEPVVASRPRKISFVKPAKN